MLPKMKQKCANKCILPSFNPETRPSRKKIVSKLHKTEKKKEAHARRKADREK